MTGEVVAYDHHNLKCAVNWPSLCKLANCGLLWQFQQDCFFKFHIDVNVIVVVLILAVPGQRIIE